jgi:hypothetical protein
VLRPVTIDSPVLPWPAPTRLSRNGTVTAARRSEPWGNRLTTGRPSAAGGTAPAAWAGPSVTWRPDGPTDPAPRRSGGAGERRCTRRHRSSGRDRCHPRR